MSIDTTQQTVGELRQTYGSHFAPGYGDNDPLDKILANAGVSSLDEYLSQTAKS